METSLSGQIPPVFQIKQEKDDQRSCQEHTTIGYPRHLQNGMIFPGLMPTTSSPYTRGTFVSNSPLYGSYSPYMNGGGGSRGVTIDLTNDGDGSSPNPDQRSFTGSHGNQTGTAATGNLNGDMESLLKLSNNDNNGSHCLNIGGYSLNKNFNTTAQPTPGTSSINYQNNFLTNGNHLNGFIKQSATPIAPLYTSIPTVGVPSSLKFTPDATAAPDCKPYNGLTANGLLNSGLNLEKIESHEKCASWLLNNSLDVKPEPEEFPPMTSPPSQNYYDVLNRMSVRAGTGLNGTLQQPPSSVQQPAREKPYKCYVCLKSFTQQSTLTGHLRIHTGEKPFACEYCEKRFSHRNYLTVHTRIHTGVKPYHCDYCGKNFTQQGTLKHHIRIHTGERPFQCEICLKRFAHRNYLTMHTRIHTGERPFTCSHCDKSFRQRVALANHLKMHTGGVVYRNAANNRNGNNNNHNNSNTNNNNHSASNSNVNNNSSASNAFCQ